MAFWALDFKDFPIVMIGIFIVLSFSIQIICFSCKYKQKYKNTDILSVFQCESSNYYIRKGRYQVAKKGWLIVGQKVFSNRNKSYNNTKKLMDFSQRIVGNF